MGIIEDDWFIQLSRSTPDELNFWHAAASPPRHMDPGTLFLFKLHAPNNFIVGGGYFVHFSALPCFLAWQAFGEKNGLFTLRDLVDKIGVNRQGKQNSGTEIGCNILNSPFFFPEEDWIPIPENWSPNIQRGLTYDTDEQYGKELWQAVQEKLSKHSININQNDLTFGEEYLAGVYARKGTSLGSGAFQVLVTDAYHRRCAVTDEKTLPALEVAYIKSPDAKGPNRTDNGILLRADINRLFNDGYVTLDENLHFIVSERVREQFEDGRDYYRFHGAKLQNLPDSSGDLPSAEFIAWHNAERFEKE